MTRCNVIRLCQCQCGQLRRVVVETDKVSNKFFFISFTCFSNNKQYFEFTISPLRNQHFLFQNIMCWVVTATHSLMCWVMSTIAVFRERLTLVADYYFGPSKFSFGKKCIYLQCGYDSKNRIILHF